MMDASTNENALGLGGSFSELATREGLIRLDRAFLDALAASDREVHARLLAARAAPDLLDEKAESELVVAAGPHLDAFLAELFGIEAGVAASAARSRVLEP